MELPQLKELYENASNERNQFKELMNNIYTLCIPGKNTWMTSGKVKAGARTDINVFNSRPVNSTKKFAAKLVSLVAPNGTQFFEIGSRDELSKEQEEIFKQKSAGVAEKVLKHLNNSNFYQALNEAFVDLAPGMGGILVNYDSNDGELCFKSLDMSRVCVLEDSRGVLDYVFREIGSLDKQDMARLYPDVDFGEVSNVDLVESVIKEQGKYIFRLSDKDFSRVYKQSENKANPFVIFRWDRRPGENRGRGLLSDFIGSIKMTNTMMKDIDEAAARIISPPMITDKSSGINVNNVRIAPNSLITLADATSRFDPLPFNGNLPFALQEVRMFNDDLDDALMINILGQVGQGQLTATEVSERMQLAAEILGQFYSRIQRELLTPLFHRVIELLQINFVLGTEFNTNVTEDENGQPKTTEKKLAFKYQSPILNMQRQIATQRLLQAAQFTATIGGQQGQQLLNAAFKTEEIPHYVADSLGVDMRLIYTVDETKQNLQKMQQQQQQAMQQDRQAQLAIEMVKRQGNPALSQPVTPGASYGGDSNA